MKKVNLVMAAASLSLALFNSDLSKSQTDIISSLADYFKISYCLLEMEAGKKILETFSRPEKINPAKRNLLTTWMNLDQISGFVNGNESFRRNGKTMIVLMANNETLHALERIFPGRRSFSHLIWIAFSREDLQPERFQKIYVPFDCEFVYVRIRQNDFFSMTEIYRITGKSNLETFELGNWTAEDGNRNLVAEPLYARRNNLKGYGFQAAINNNPPYVTIERNQLGKPVFKGYLYEIWTELELRIHFRTKFPENYFDKDPRLISNWKDMDFALGRISIDPKDFPLMDFSQPISVAESYAFGHRLGPQLSWDSYLRPFSSNTWFVTFVWLLFSSFAFAVLYRAAWNFGTSEREAKNFLFTFSESFLTVFRAICMQGSDVTPKSHSCRLFFLSITMTATIVTSAFSAALFSLLTIPKPKSDFKTLNEILNSGRHEIALPSDVEFQESFEEFSNSLWSSQSILKDRLMESKLYSTAEKGLNRVCREKSFVFVHDLPIVLSLMQNMTRDCQEKIFPLDRPLFAEYIAIGFRKNNPYKKLFDLHLTRMKNEGILRRIFLNNWPPPIPAVSASWVRVTLADISPILYMYILGAISGVIILAIERSIVWLTKKRKSKIN